MTPPTRLTTADLPGRTTNGLASGATGGSFHHPRRRRQHRDYHTVAKVDFVHVGTVKHAPPPRHRCCSILDRLQVGPGELLLRVTRSGCCSSHPTKSPATLGCLPSRLWGARTGSISTGLQFPESAGDLHAARSYSLISRAPWNRLAPLRRHDHATAARRERAPCRIPALRFPDGALGGVAGAAHRRPPQPMAVPPGPQRPPRIGKDLQLNPVGSRQQIAERRRVFACGATSSPAGATTRLPKVAATGTGGSRVISGRSWPDVEDGHGLIVKSVPDAVGTAAG